MENLPISWKNTRVSFIGAGNVAVHLSKALFDAGARIVSVHARTQASTPYFSETYGSSVATRLSDIPESDIYIFAVKDDVLPQLVEEFGQLHLHGLCLHTAGSVPMEIFKGNVERYGVLYPLQTFSRQRPISFNEIPLFVESHDAADLQLLLNLAKKISKSVFPLDSDQRRKLHLAAVFACNFTNHCYAIAGNILEKAGLSEQLLLPLVTETLEKFKSMSAVEAQTGPAVRYDQQVMQRQIDLLTDQPLQQKVYKAMSESIHAYAEHKK